MSTLSRKSFQEIDIALIKPPETSVRFEIPQERIRELAESIREQGLLQPIILRKKGDEFEIVAGDRRVRACLSLDHTKITAMVTDMDDEAVALARASENITRDDLSPVEEGAVYKDLRDRVGLSVDKIAKKMGKTVGVVKRRMDLLKMPSALQEAIHAGKISYGVAEEFWSLGDEGAISYYLEFAIEHLPLFLRLPRSYLLSKKRYCFLRPAIESLQDSHAR